MLGMKVNKQPESNLTHHSMAKAGKGLQERDKAQGILESMSRFKIW